MLIYYFALIILFLVDYVSITSIQEAKNYRKKNKNKNNKKEIFKLILEDLLLLVLPVVLTIVLVVLIFMDKFGYIELMKMNV